MHPQNSNGSWSSVIRGGGTKREGPKDVSASHISEPIRMVALPLADGLSDVRGPTSQFDLKKIQIRIFDIKYVHRTDDSDKAVEPLVLDSGLSTPQTWNLGSSPFATPSEDGEHARWNGAWD
jgi:hypothetical protein